MIQKKHMLSPVLIKNKNLNLPTLFFVKGWEDKFDLTLYSILSFAILKDIIKLYFKVFHTKPISYQNFKSRKNLKIQTRFVR